MSCICETCEPQSLHMLVAGQFQDGDRATVLYQASPGDNPEAYGYLEHLAEQDGQEPAEVAWHACTEHQKAWLYVRQEYVEYAVWMPLYDASHLIQAIVNDQRFRLMPTPAMTMNPSTRGDVLYAIERNPLFGYAYLTNAPTFCPN